MVMENLVEPGCRCYHSDRTGVFEIGDSEISDCINHLYPHKILFYVTKRFNGS